MFHHTLLITTGSLALFYLIWVATEWRQISWHLHSIFMHKGEPELRYNLGRILDDFLEPCYAIRYFLSNIWFYAPILWNDRWWDYGYLLEYLAKRLRRDARMYETHGHHAEFQMQADEMKEAADICERLHEDRYYENNGYDAHVEKYGHGFYPSNDPEERALFLEISKKAREAEDRDTKRLGELFTHVRNWWD